MGFLGSAWKFAKNAGTMVAGAIEKQANEVREIRQEYEAKSDEELIRILKDTGTFGKSSTQRGVAFGILKKTRI